MRNNTTDTEEDSENFWKVAADNSVFWDAYVSTRPNYSASFYKEIYDHHATHSSSWTLAHDVGCGAGQVAAELSSRFEKVVASDNNDTHLSVAQRRLSQQDLAPSRISFTHTMGEDLHKHHTAGSVDLIAAAEAMVLMDAPSALTSFATMLKPGGTLATWFYGRPTFSDPTLFADAQPLLDQIMVRNWAKVIQGGGPKRKAGFKRAADGMASWLDYVDFNPHIWKEVHRIKWNSQATLPFFGQEACGFEIDAVSSVKAGIERVEEREDWEWWRNDWDLGELKRYFSVLFPGFKEAVGEGDKEINRLYKELSELMGGERQVRQFTWPAVLVMATKT
ncbi:hypothetical protein MMC10_009146 [Thelotrema lepadinum]|nr:hypothetical protein [Thelotrema lepadinum]